MKFGLRFIRKAICALLAILMIVCCYSCKKDDVSNDVNDTEEKIEQDLVINGQYKIIYPRRNMTAWGIASQFKQLLINKCGIDLEVISDSVESTEYEIIIAVTNRDEFLGIKDKIEENDIIIAVEEKKLIIYASADKYYSDALDYIEKNYITDGELKIYDDLWYAKKCDDIVTFLTDEKVGKSKTTINITLKPKKENVNSGIFVGNNEIGQGIIGYKGYCLVATSKNLILYDVTDQSIKEMASKRIPDVSGGKEFTIRMELDGSVCRGYILDDADGVEPWPEFELPIKKCDGYGIGYVNLSKDKCTYKDLKVTYGDKTKYSGETYTNDVFANYADPDVIYHDGKYYLYGTGSPNGYMVHSSTDLVNWKTEGVAAAKGSLWGIDKNYWAPDIEYINGKFYMVASCNENIGIAVSDSPLGPFSPLGDNVLYEKSIDGHLFIDDDGRIYLYYVSWISKYGIYGVELNSDMTPKGTPKRIIYPNEEWEQQYGSVTEGPFMLKKNGVYYLTYSGSGYETTFVKGKVCMFTKS